jgi:UDP-3-O-[3-hydroxymyristoyl] N-acetylglucosamine deacetylase
MTHTLQMTLGQPVHLAGIGRDSGRRMALTIQPGDEDSGLVFVRTDRGAGDRVIPARWHHVSATQPRTLLTNDDGVSIASVETVLAALSGCGIDNASIEVDGPEVPCLDGSAEPFVRAIERAGRVTQYAPRRVLWIRRPVTVRAGQRYLTLSPAPTRRITLDTGQAGAIPGSEYLSVELAGSAFRRQLASARTVAFAGSRAGVRRHRLAPGGAACHALPADDERLADPHGLRYPDEFLRHQMLDCLGHLALAGVPVMGHLHARQPDHALQHALLKALFRDPGAWSHLRMDEVRLMTGVGVPEAPVPRGSAVPPRRRPDNS